MVIKPKKFRFLKDRKFRFFKALDWREGYEGVGWFQGLLGPTSYKRNKWIYGIGKDRITLPSLEVFVTFK